MAVEANPSLLRQHAAVILARQAAMREVKRLRQKKGIRETLPFSTLSRLANEWLPIMTQHYPMLQRNLRYTGVTRGERLVVLVGQKKAVAIAVRNVSGRTRWSKLKEWLGSRAFALSG
jgi:hypothetical protein